MITELDGLAKGSREGQYDCSEHARNVRLRAEQTIAYLEHEFSARHSHLRALTAMGNELDTIAFRSEETSGKVWITFIGLKYEKKEKRVINHRNKIQNVF